MVEKVSIKNTTADVELKIFCKDTLSIRVAEHTHTTFFIIYILESTVAFYASSEYS